MMHFVILFWGLVGFLAVQKRPDHDNRVLEITRIKTQAHAQTQAKYCKGT